MLSLVEITAFRLKSKLPPMRALEFIRDDVTFKLPYDFSYHMKTPLYRIAVYNECINYQKWPVDFCKKKQLEIKMFSIKFRNLK